MNKCAFAKLNQPLIKNSRREIELNGLKLDQTSGNRIFTFESTCKVRIREAVKIIYQIYHRK